MNYSCTIQNECNRHYAYMQAMVAQVLAQALNQYVQTNYPCRPCRTGATPATTAETGTTATTVGCGYFPANTCGYVLPNYYNCCR